MQKKNVAQSARVRPEEMASIVNASHVEAGVYYQPRPYFEIDTPLVPAHEWPLALIDLASSRGLEEHKLLRGTGIFREDISDNNLQLSPQQCFLLIINIQKHMRSSELSFLLGHRFFASLDIKVFHALNNAADLQTAIDVLGNQQTLLLPLLNLRSSYEQDRLVIYWQDAYGADTVLIFLLEIISTALSALARRHSGENLPWQFYFTHSKPAYIEQYQVHLNSNVEFSSQVNAMAIARDYLYIPWPSISQNENYATEAPVALAAEDLHQPPHVVQRGFLSELYNYLYHNIQRNPNLEQTAAAFGMSNASLKRKLKKHHSHFQEQYDLVRKDLALYWLHQAGWSKEEVAQKLHFYDVANLRRAFKKWTGKLPQTIVKVG